MGKRVVIIGNSSAARECYWLLQEIMPLQSNLSFKGFLAFEGHPGNLKELSECDLGPDDSYDMHAEDVFVIGIAHPQLRSKAFEKWKARGATFINLIHSFTTVPQTTTMGEGNIIACACYFSCNVTIGNANFFNGAVALGHDVHIGDANFFGPETVVLGDVSIGSENSFAVRSTVLAGAKIGHNNRIAPGAFIYKGCRDNCLMAGNPALHMNDDAKV